MPEIKNGEYIVEVSLSGGSGRATVMSPTKLTAEDGELRAEIEWSSPNYDYMEVGGEAYYPVNDGGNSRFVIDVPVLGEEILVLAETVAMSEPHMIEYSLKFDPDTLRPANGHEGIIIGAAVALLAAAVVLKRRWSRAKM